MRSFALQFLFLFDHLIRCDDFKNYNTCDCRETKNIRKVTFTCRLWQQAVRAFQFSTCACINDDHSLTQVLQTFHEQLQAIPYKPVNFSATDFATTSLETATHIGHGQQRFQFNQSGIYHLNSNESKARNSVEHVSNCWQKTCLSLRVFSSFLI